MKFYVKQHKYYCGVDLHARSMYVCIIDEKGVIVKQKNMESGPEEFLSIIEPYREDIVVAVECMFAWYWLSDLCRRVYIGPFHKSEHHGANALQPFWLDWKPGLPIPLYQEGLGEIFKLHKAVQHVLPLTRS